MKKKAKKRKVRPLDKDSFIVEAYKKFALDISEDYKMHITDVSKLIFSHTAGWIIDEEGVGSVITGVAIIVDDYEKYNNKSKNKRSKR